MLPPSASIFPAWFTYACSGRPSMSVSRAATLSSTAKVTSLSPKRSSVKLFPEASTTRPSSARMTPEFSTPGATSATSPPACAVISPRLTMTALRFTTSSNL